MTAIRARDSLVTLLVCSTFLSAVAALVFVSSRPETPDAVVLVCVAKGIVERQDFTPARDWRDRPMPEQKHGLGLSLPFAAPYAFARVVAADPIRAAMATNALVFGFTVTSLLALARLLDLPWRQALVATLLTAAGTPLLPFVATGFSELAMAAAVTLGLVAVAAAGKGRAWAAPLAGARPERPPCCGRTAWCWCFRCSPWASSSPRGTGGACGRSPSPPLRSF